MRDELIEVVETSVFRQRAEKRLTENELDQLIMMLAARRIKVKTGSERIAAGLEEALAYV